MTFGSRRITLRNRRFLRKYTPVQIPVNTPTGFSKHLNVSEIAPAPPQHVPDKKVTIQQQPPLVLTDDRVEPLPVPVIQQDSHYKHHCTVNQAAVPE